MPLFWISLAFLTGIILASNLTLPILGWILPGTISLILASPPIYKRWVCFIPASISQINQKLRIPSPVFYPLFVLFISLGAIRYELAKPHIDSSSIAYFNDYPEEVILQGVVVDSPDVRDTYSNLRVRVEQLRRLEDLQFTEVNGLLLAKISGSSALRYGDRIRLEGHLETPPENEDFSYRDYLAHQSIYSYLSFPKIDLLQHGQGNPIYAFLYSFRQHAQNAIYKLIPDPEASLIAGIVLGVQTGIPERVQEAFRITGTSHIIVISGFNITIIASLFTFLFRRLLGRYKGAILTTGGIVIYTLLVGANAAVVRAAILGLFTLVGHLIGRRQAGITSLAFAAAIMAIKTPSVLWDVSFQLSFAATLGIFLYAEPMTEWFVKLVSRFIPQSKAEKLAGPVSEYFLLTLAAQLTTLPLMVYYFKRISMSALIANPLILPAQPPLMILGGLSALTGVISQPLGQFFGWAAWPFAAYTIRVVEWIATIPHGSIALGKVSLAIVLLFYGLLFTITFTRAHISTLAARLTPAIPLAILSICTVMAWKAAFYAPDGMLHVTILDVGTGEAVLLQSPTGRAILVDGGPSTVRLSDALGRRLPLFNRSLDWLVVGGIDDEDLAGVPGNLERFSPSNVLWAGNSYGSYPASNLWAVLTESSIPITTMDAGHSLDLGAGATLRVLSIDERGAVLLVEWHNFRMLLPTGMAFDNLEDLLESAAMRNVSAVLLAESGYAPLNPPDLISFLHPQVAILSVAAGDKEGLPSPETIEALEGYNLLRTDQNGWIELSTDGKQMWVEVERR